MKQKIIIFLFILSGININTFAQDAIYLDSVTGLNPETGGIAAGVPIEYRFNFRVETNTLLGFTNGMRIYSPDGATWETPTLEFNPFMLPFGFLSINYYSVTGTGSDTVGFGGLASMGFGIPVAYDGWSSTIYTQVSSDDIGKTLCIDSSFFPPENSWFWLFPDQLVTFPEWDGPHCFEIVDCCSGERGDFNYDGELNIADLTAFVSWFHKGGTAPVCQDEGDIDGLTFAGTPINTADLSYYVRYLFKDGPPPAACP